MFIELTSAMSVQAATPTPPQAIITRRRSILSEIRPIGIWAIAPPASTDASSVAPSAVVRPIVWV